MELVETNNAGMCNLEGLQTKLTPEIEPFKIFPFLAGFRVAYEDQRVMRKYLNLEKSEP